MGSKAQARENVGEVSPVKVLQVNLNHCRAAQDLVMQVAREESIDLLAISEQYRDKEEMSGWFPDCTSRSAVVVCTDQVRVEDIGEAGLGFRVITIQGIRFYSCYISPNIDLEGFEMFLKDLDVSVRRGSGEAIIAGDFNSKSRSWGCPTTNRRGAAMDVFIASLSLVILNVGGSYTCRRGDGGSIVDLTLATEGVASRITDWQVLSSTVTLSDHDYITYVIETSPRKIEKVRPLGWSVRALNPTIFSWVMESIDSHSLCAEDMAGAVVSQVQGVCDVVLPRRSSARGRVPVYWWSQEIAEIRRRCQAARRAVTRARGRDLAADVVQRLVYEFKAAKKELSMAIRASKKRCWQELCDAVERDPFGRAYKIVTGKIIGRNRIPELEKEGRMSAIVEGLFPPSVEEFGYDSPLAYPLGRDGGPFRMEELDVAIKSLRGGKAPGPDGIGNEVVKATYHADPSGLLRLYNSCRAEGVFPSRWKVARLILLRKDGKPLDRPSSYRPICLIDCFGKVLEKLIVQRLNRHIEETGCLSGNQYGFRRGRSTVDAMKELTTRVDRQLGRGKFCLAVSLDISNAFNTANWGAILEAMGSRGFAEDMWALVRHYFRERRIRYEVGADSVTRRMRCGVPQGSVLGPALWIIMFDDLFRQVLPPGVSLVCFADDTLVIIESDGAEEAVAIANRAMRVICGWMHSVGLMVSAQKTNAVLFTRRRSFRVPALEISGQGIALSPSLKYLGVIFDKRLTFAPHFRQVSERAIRLANALGRILPRVGGPSDAKRRLLMSVVNSILLYGAPVWHKAMTVRRSRGLLLRPQRLMALRCIRAYRTVSLEAALVLAAAPPVHLVASYREEVHRLSLRTREEQRRARDRMLDMWEREWREGERASWTKRVIPSIRDWVERKHGALCYHLTQVLSGHGCFRKYLARIGKDDSGLCRHCNVGEDDAEHTVVTCPAWAEQRARLCDGRYSVEKLARDILDPECWKKVQEFCREVLKKKEEEERSRQTFH